MRRRAAIGLGAALALAGCGGGGGPADAGTPAADAAPLAEASAPPPDLGRDGPLAAADADAPDAARDTSPDVVAADPCGKGGPLSTAAVPIIDAFPTAAAIIVVRQDALLLVARDGTVTRTVPSPRPITTAQFDGQHLVVGDRAMLLVYSPALEEQGHVLLRESCAASALLAGGRFVCGPANDWDRVFYTYDLAGPQLVARSTGTFTYDGIPMQAIPRTPYFLTSDGTFFKVAASGDTTIVTRGYSSDRPQGGRFAFFGDPPSHLITAGGQMYRIFGNGCDGMTSAVGQGCFVRDGDLGTGHAFLALTSDATGAQLFGVTGTGGYDAPCSAGCSVQHIDIAARTVLSEKRHLLELGAPISAHHDGTCGRLLLVYRKPGAGPAPLPGATPPEHQVALLEY